MIGVQVTKDKIADRGRDVCLNCDTEGAKRLIEILQMFLEFNKKDHEHLTGLDGYEDEPFIMSEYYEFANGLDINFKP